MSYLVYDAETGKILRTLTGAANLQEMAAQSQAPNEIILEGDFDDRLFHVVEHVAVPRPRVSIPDDKTITGDDVDSFLIGNVPAGTEVAIRNFGVERTDPAYLATFTVDDGAFEWSSTRAGLYSFLVAPPFPWQRETFEVVVQ
ncbi:hypothetical protein [Devosia sp. 2618]|uniref:hypothetical protein n=1 Tax=Devosia sp. 2618 TaxID=3156454 RepID=UPI00339A80C7